VLYAYRMEILDMVGSIHRYTATCWNKLVSPGLEKLFLLLLLCAEMML